MFFHFLGVSFLIAFFVVLKKSRRGRCGSGGGSGHGRHHRRRHRSFWRRGLDPMFERLDTSPGQEKEIRSAMSALFDDVVPARREMKRAMKQIFSTALREDVFDEAAVRKAIGEQEDRIVGLRESLIAMLGRVHEALDEEQRAQLAAFAARRMAPSMGGPYR